MKYVKTYESLFQEDIDPKILEKMWRYHHQGYRLANPVLLKVGPNEYYEWHCYQNDEDDRILTLENYTLGKLKNDYICPMPEFERFPIHPDSDNSTQYLNGESLLDFYDEILYNYPQVMEVLLRRGSGKLKWEEKD